MTFFFLLASLRLLTPLSAQPSSDSYLDEVYHSENGLPIGNINQVYQTPDGFLWMATYSGLVRFDGLRYHVYSVSEYPDLTSNRIVTIQEGLGNSFWLTTEQRDLIRFIDGKFRKIGLNSIHQRVILDGDSVEWVLSFQGLAKVKSDTTLLLNPSDTEFIRSFERLENGSILVGSSKQNLYISKYPYNSFTEISALPDGEIPRNTKKENEVIWSYNRKIFSWFEDKWIEPINTEIIESNWSTIPPLYYNLHRLESGKILISAETGLFTISDGFVEELEIQNKSELPTEAERINGKTCRCANGDVWAYANSNVFLNGKFAFQAREEPIFIYCDRENNIWTVLRKNGLQRFRKSNLKNVVSEDGHNNYYGIYEDKAGRKWFGEQHLYLYYLENDTVHPVQSDYGLGTTSVFLEASNNWFIVGNRYWDRNASDLIPSSFEDFQVIDGINEKVYSIFEDRDSTIWFGTGDGLFTFRSGSTHEIKLPGPYYTVRFIIQDKNGLIWMATNGGGVYTFDPSQQNWNVHNTESGLSSNNIRAVLEVDNGKILIATEDAGLIYFDTTSDEMTRLSTEDGLYQDGIHSLVLDDFNRLWMSTNYGIFYVDFLDLKKKVNNEIERFNAIVYTEKNGMLNREANGGFQNAGFADKEGKIWFPTQDGIVVIDPNAETKYNDDFDINIVDIQVGDSQLTTVDPIVYLSSNQGDVRISYSTPTFISPARVEYSYILEGFNESWTQVEDGTEAVFTNLPGGEYMFRVKASLDDNEEALAQTSFQIIKEPRFHERWIFYVGVFLAVLLIFYAIYQFRLRQLKRHEAELEAQVKARTEELEAEKRITESQKEELIKLDKEKSNFFSNITHEFRTPLTLISGPLEELKEKSEEFTPAATLHLDRALRNSKRLNNLVDQLLDISKIQTGELELIMAQQPAIPFIVSICDDYVSLAESNDIAYSIRLEVEGILMNYDTHQLDKVFHNLLSNAFKFTPRGGTIEVRVFTDPEIRILHFEITDSGPGIARKDVEEIFERFYQVEKSELQSGSGLGLSIAKEVSQLHGGSLDLVSTSAAGTVFRVSLPAMKSIQGERFHAKEKHSQNGNEASEQAEVVPLELRGKTVLIVEDNEDIRNYLSESLEATYHVLVADSGNKALVVLKNLLPDLIISDVMMADGDGMHLLKAIRNDVRMDYLPVILLTAKSQVADRLEGLGIGADDYITKPFNMDLLKARISNIFRQRERLKRYFKENREDAKTAITIEEKPFKNQDKEWLDKLMNVVSQRLGEESFNVSSLADYMSVSRTGLYRKLNDLTSETPQNLLTRLRMERAEKCIHSNLGSMSEIAYACGYASLSHFSKSFKKHFGCNPSEFAQEREEK